MDMKMFSRDLGWTDEFPKKLGWYSVLWESDDENDRPQAILVVAVHTNGFAWSYCEADDPEGLSDDNRTGLELFRYLGGWEEERRAEARCEHGPDCICND